jgi:hypothetical protein
MATAAVLEVIQNHNETLVECKPWETMDPSVQYHLDRELDGRKMLKWRQWLPCYSGRKFTSTWIQERNVIACGVSCTVHFESCLLPGVLVTQLRQESVRNVLPEETALIVLKFSDIRPVPGGYLGIRWMPKF